MQFIIAISLLFVMSVGVTVVLYLNSELRAKETLKNLKETYGDTRFRFNDKVKIKHSFFNRSDCHGVITKEIYLQDMKLGFHGYCYDVDVYVNGKAVTNNNFSSNDLELVEEVQKSAEQ